MNSEPNLEVKLAERYEVAFNQIHQSLKKIVKTQSDRFTKLVTHGSRSNSILRQYQDELYQYAKLRNAIVHDKTALGFYIAEPHYEVVERIEEIAHVLMKPKYALSIATKPVITFDFNDSIESVIQGIKQHEYSRYPIYKEGYCIGLMSARTVVKWMAENVVSSIVELTNSKVSDVFVKEKNHPIKYASKTMNIFDVEEIFSKAHANKDDLEMIVITENGLPDEPPLGLITPWDLIEIDYTAD